MRLLKFAFIGCGKIAHFHADVVRHLGHSIDYVVARENSSNIDSFSVKYSVKNKFYALNHFIDCCKDKKNNLDCIIVCTPWDMTEKILKSILILNIPIMSEKPAVISISAFNQLKQMPNIKNLFVAYNRRFYDFIPYLKGLIDKERLICVDILSADPYEMIVKSQGEKIRKYILYYYTSHVIDLLFFLFEDIQVKNIANIRINGKNSWICQLYSKKYQCPIQMKVIMDSPQNSHFKVFFEKKVAQMRPLEMLYLYNKIEKKEINGNAVYSPSIEKEIATDNRFKPGFLNQMSYFINNFVYSKNSSREYIKRLEQVTVFCDRLLNSNVL